MQYVLALAEQDYNQQTLGNRFILTSVNTYELTEIKSENAQVAVIIIRTPQKQDKLYQKLNRCVENSETLRSYYFQARLTHSFYHIHLHLSHIHLPQCGLMNGIVLNFKMSLTWVYEIKYKLVRLEFNTINNLASSYFPQPIFCFSHSPRTHHASLPEYFLYLEYFSTKFLSMGSTRPPSHILALLIMMNPLEQSAVLFICPLNGDFNKLTHRRQEPNFYFLQYCQLEYSSFF